MDPLMLQGFRDTLMKKQAGDAPPIRPLYKRLALLGAGWAGGHTLENAYTDWKTGRQFRKASGGGLGGY